LEDNHRIRVPILYRMSIARSLDPLMPLNGEGSFASVRELVEAIDEFLAVRNEEPKRYVWRAKGEDILRKIERAKTALARVITS